MSILFIRGFNTNMTSSFDETKFTYSNFDNFFEMSKYDFNYFNYSPEENLDDVYSKLETQLMNGSYTILMGHSMGGGLLLKFLTEHPEKIETYTKIIFLMPMITKVFSTELICKIPFIDKMYLPKCLIIPNNNLFNNGNILNDSFKLLCSKQVVTMYNDKNYISKMNLSIIDKPNCVMIYAKDEMLSTISSDVLEKIENKYILEGKHEMFNESNHSNKFFRTLKLLL